MTNNHASRRIHSAEVLRTEPLVVHSQGLRLIGERLESTSAARSKGTVLLLHGGGQRRHSWRRTGRRLALDGWSATAFDARGHGDSDWSPEGDYSLDALIGDLAEVVTSIGETPILVGASMGGMTALVGQGDRGDLARALVLVDIVPRVEPEGVKRIMDFMAGAPNGFASLEDVADAVRRYNPRRKPPKHFDGLRRNVRQRSDGRWYWHWDPQLLNSDEPTRHTGYQRAKAAAARISVATLLVRGAESDIVSKEGIAELLELIPGAKHVDVSSTGHMVAGDDNDIFTGALAEFLASVSEAV